MYSDDSDKLSPVSPLRICPPVKYLRSPVNYFSRPLPNDVRNLIIYGLRTPNRPLPSCDALCPCCFKASYHRYLEWRDLLWVKLILVEETGVHLSDHEPLYASCKNKMKKLAFLTSWLTNSLEDMRNPGRELFHHTSELEDLKRKRHHYYGQNHPVRLISPYLHRDKILVYLNSFPQYELYNGE